MPTRWKCSVTSFSIAVAATSVRPISSRRNGPIAYGEGVTVGHWSIVTSPSTTPCSGCRTLPSSSDVLHDRVVVCAGGGSGIGRAAVDAFLLAGARVAVLEHDAAKAGAVREL